TAAAKRQPDMPFATGGGVGSPQAIVGLWYAKLAGVTLKLVPYRGGGPAINDLIAGHVKLGLLGTTPLIPHYQAGSLSLLAQSSATRSAALPNVPTFREAGVNAPVGAPPRGVVVPARTPADIGPRPH